MASDLYYNKVSKKLESAPTSDAFTKLSSQQISQLGGRAVAGSSGEDIDTLVNPNQKALGQALPGAPKATPESMATASPYLPSAGTGASKGYSSAATDPNYVTGRQQLAAPIDTALPPTPSPYAYGRQPDDPLNQYNTATGQPNPRYQQALTQMQQSGIPAPQDGGQARAMTQGAISAPPAPVNPLIAETLGADKGMGDLITQFQEYLNPEVQRKSLREEYESIIQESGLEKINTDLMNMKNVMEGTEQDIRTEITKSGGFATESQVMALSNARNKNLIKNYNKLLDQQALLQNNISTIMGLEKEDRAQAQQDMETRFNFTTKLMDMQQKIQQNAQDTLNNVVKQVGYAGLAQMTNGDPYYTSLVEKTLGIAPGGLEQLANYTPPQTEEEKLNLELKKGQLDLQQSNLLTDKAQRAKIYADIAKTDADNNVMVDQGGKVLLQPKEAMKINKEIANTDAFKAITKGKDSLQFLKQFEETFNKTGATSAVFSPRQNADLKTKYNTAILNLKEFFNLGVLNGPDEAILRGVLPDPTNRSAALTVGSLGLYKPSTATKSGIENMKKMIESSLDERYKSLTSQYGDYSGSSVGAIKDLNRIYVEQKSKLNPNIDKLKKDNPNLTDDDIISIISQ